MKYVVRTVGDFNVPPKETIAASPEAAALYVADLWYDPDEGFDEDPYEVCVKAEDGTETVFTIETDVQPRFTAVPKI